MARGGGRSIAAERRRQRHANVLMSKAQAFRASSILRFWSRAATPEASMRLPSSQPQQSLLPPPQSTLPMPPQPQSTAENSAPEQPTQQQTEQMAIGDRSKRAGPSTPLAGSPATSRAKRTLRLPDDPPPPSVPPSPPSPKGRDKLPEPHQARSLGSNQRDDQPKEELVATPARERCSTCGERVQEYSFSQHITVSIAGPARTTLCCTIRMWNHRISHLSLHKRAPHGRPSLGRAE